MTCDVSSQKALPLMTFRDHILYVAFAAFLLQPVPLFGDDNAPALQTRITQYLADLGSDDFSVRSEATKQLEKIGAPAIAPLVKLAQNGELEATNRALQILASFYNTKDDDTLDALDTALEELADSDTPSAARRAAAALSTHAADRDRRAVKQLHELGAMIRPLGIGGFDDDAGGVLQIWIDDQWQGGDEQLKLFRRLSPGRLQAIYRVEGCPATLDAVRKLEQQIPGMGVQERGAACLGLGAGDPKPRGFQIQVATPEGSIAAAGIRSNDVIIKYGDKNVDNFEQLVEMIKKNKAGDTVKVGFLRLVTTDDNIVEEVELSADVRLKSWREVFDDAAKAAQKLSPANQNLPQIDPRSDDDPQPQPAEEDASPNDK